VALAAHHTKRAAGLTNDAPYEPETEMAVGVSEVASAPDCVCIARAQDVEVLV